MHSNDSNAEPTKDYVIDRTTWLRGEGPQKSSLFRPKDGKMCCLGQIALQKGYTWEEIAGRTDPRDLDDGWENWPSYIPGPGKAFDLVPSLNEMMVVNDDTCISEEKRESTLIDLGKELGWNLIFIN